MTDEVNMMDTEHFTAVVTGGSRGIGAEICRRMASEGFHVIINYNNSKECAVALKDEIIKAGGHADIYKADVSKSEEAESLM